MVGPRLRVGKKARADLQDIGRYMLKRWGRDQANGTWSTSTPAFNVSTPSLGRVYAPLPPYWRDEQGSHVVFFRRETNRDVVIVRVLHERMLPELHLGKRDDEPE